MTGARTRNTGRHAGPNDDSDKAQRAEVRETLSLLQTAAHDAGLPFDRRAVRRSIHVLRSAGVDPLPHLMGGIANKGSSSRLDPASRRQVGTHADPTAETAVRQVSLARPA